MGADLTLLNVKEDEGEPVADSLVRASSLHAAEIGGSIIPTLIDELPMIAAMACFAEGTTVIRDAAELKVKESNRIAVMVENLSAMGADVTETEDGMIIRGGRPLHGAVIESHLDHRIAMTLSLIHIWLRKVLSGFRRTICRGLQTLSGVSFYLYKKTHDPGIQSQCG